MSAPAEAAPPTLLGEGDLVAVRLRLVDLFRLRRDGLIEPVVPWVVRVSREDAHVARLLDREGGLLGAAPAPPAPPAVLARGGLLRSRRQVRLRLVLGLGIALVRRGLRGRLVRLVSGRSADDRHRIRRLLRFLE